MQTSISCVVCDYGYTSLRTVPKTLMNLDVLVSGTVMFPLLNPLFNHLSHVSARNGHLFDAEYFQSRSVQHLFDSA